MSMESVLKEVNGIFRRELGNDNLEISYETTAQDVPEWDSLTHILLVVAIEKHFGIKFTSTEIEGFKNAGHMCEAVVRKKGN